jgi:hypothetical protein
MFLAQAIAGTVQSERDKVPVKVLVLPELPESSGDRPYS